jgi:carbamate kinase
MRVVVALGGNALLHRGEPLTAENQRANVRVACEALAPIAEQHELVISHGNGPQVGLLALQGAAYRAVDTYPLDVLDAQTEGMIGYLIEQELGNLLPETASIATLLTMIEVDPADPAFAQPTKPIGPVYEQAEADALTAEKGWIFHPDGHGVRRVVPSPLPRRIFGLKPVQWLLERGCVVVCTGGGGIPTAYSGSRASGDRRLVGVEAVIDKDRASALLAQELRADALIIATDVDAVYDDWGALAQRALRLASPDALAGSPFAEGSMGPKVEAACAFARRPGTFAAIGTLADIGAMLRGEAGTIISSDAAGIEYAEAAHGCSGRAVTVRAEATATATATVGHGLASGGR